MRQYRYWILALLVPATLGSCTLGDLVFEGLPIETSFAFTNFSRDYYAAFGVRAHAGEDNDAPFFYASLLPPGATQRMRFLDALGIGCPDSIDLRLLLYKRVNDDLPIGLDPGEQVETNPIVAGEILNLPACGTQPLETYTIVNWDAPEGMARVKLAQDTPVDEAIRASGIFDNTNAAWEISGVDPNLSSVPPPALAESQSISGQVTLTDGRPVEGVVVLLRTRFRVRLEDDDATNDPDAGYSDPIDYTVTDASGEFVIDRPAGAYQVEFASDDYAFRPAVVKVETPLESIWIMAEPL